MRSIVRTAYLVVAGLFVAGLVAQVFLAGRFFLPIVDAREAWLTRDPGTA